MVDREVSVQVNNTANSESCARCVGGVKEGRTCGHMLGYELEMGRLRESHEFRSGLNMKGEI